MNESVKPISTDDLESLLGEQVRNARLRQGISQKALADRAGVALGSLRHLEGGEGATVASLVRIINALGRRDWLSSLQPQVTISPMQLLKAKQPRQRAPRKTET